MSALEPESGSIEAYIAAASALIALPIGLPFRASVAGHLARLLAVAVLLDEFPLPDEIEAAPVFRP